jgi:hypothetical protein
LEKVLGKGEGGGAGKASRVNANSIHQVADRDARVIRNLLASTRAPSCTPQSDRRRARYAGRMPETRVERIIFGVGALAIAALVALIVLEKTDRFATHQTHAATPLATTSVETATAETTTASETAAEPTTASETMAESTTAPEPRSSATGITLRLRAIADTWVEIRAGSADGDVLFSGILAQGNAKRFRGKQVWASFGAASNLTARLNGDPMQLPPGTYGALISTSGLQPLD